MQAIEFNTLIENNTIKIPENLNLKFHKSIEVKVILLIKENEEKDYNEFVKEEFFKGYSEIDSIYDE
ncbi:MAG TPA: hypothetical protein PLG90_11005 [Ignavibacteria bacterium]|nr:hypothetical protein [Ignavibacteria bacterium]